MTKPELDQDSSFGGNLCMETSACLYWVYVGMIEKKMETAVFLARSLLRARQLGRSRNLCSQRRPLLNYARFAEEMLGGLESLVRLL